MTAAGDDDAAPRRRHRHRTDEDLAYGPTSKVRNIEFLQFGAFTIRTWYFSPYPEEYSAAGTLWVCEFCLTYLKSERQFERHCAKCSLRHPPGDEIYRKGEVAVFEIDGDANRVYCQNLCLLGKVVLATKTLFYDVSPFLFYVLTRIDRSGCHLVGYFSKEKDSGSEANNVACIMTLPCYQQQGYGKQLIAFSYALTRAEGGLGSPEKPLSDLGLLSYRSYWKFVILEELIARLGERVSLQDIAKATGIKPDDIAATLQHYGMVRFWQGRRIVNVDEDMLEAHRRTRDLKKPSHTIDESCLHWRPVLYRMRV